MFCAPFPYLKWIQIQFGQQDNSRETQYSGSVVPLAMFILYVLRFASLFQFNRRKFYRLTWQLETADDIFMLMLLRQCTAYQRPYLILSFDQNETRSEQLSALPYKEDG